MQSGSWAANAARRVRSQAAFHSPPIAVVDRGISYSRYSTARNPPSTAESPRFEPIARTLPVPPRLRDNGRQDRASARVLPGSGLIRFGSGLFLRPPDPFRPTHHGGSETRAGNYPVESIRQTHPASA